MEEIRERRRATILSICAMEEIHRLMADLRDKDRQCDRGLCETDQRCDDCARGGGTANDGGARQRKERTSGGERRLLS
ncbi:hypothetical protein U1Q18_026544 [Sarracenia purpurea var. burkii]